MYDSHNVHVNGNAIFMKCSVNGCQLFVSRSRALQKYQHGCRLDYSLAIPYAYSAQDNEGALAIEISIRVL